VSETKFTPTPEPWKSELYHSSVPTIAVNDSTGHMIAIVTGNSNHPEVQSNARLFVAAPRMLRAIISMVGQGEHGNFIGRTSPNVNSLNTEGEKGIRLAVEILNELDPGGAL